MHSQWQSRWLPKPPQRKAFTQAPGAQWFGVTSPSYTLHFITWLTVTILIDSIIALYRDWGGGIKPLYPIKYRIQSFIKNHDVFRNIRKEKINTEHKRRQYVSLSAQTRTLMFQRWATYPVENFLPKRWWCLHGITLKEIPFYGGKSEL